VALGILSVRKKTRAASAATAIALVGDQARLAIPELVKLMNDPQCPESSGRAAVALAYIGKDAMPVLVAQLANPAAPNRPEVINSCGLIPVLATNVDVILPLLIRCLDDPNPRVRVQTARSLGRIAERYRLQPAIVVPALTHCLRADSPIALRRSAAKALGNYGAQAREAVPQLLQMTNDPVYFVRTAVTNALMKIDPELMTNSVVHIE
jgi:HEAT repeat protein